MKGTSLSITIYICIVILFVKGMTVSSESRGRKCRDMMFPGGSHPCPKLIKSGLYDTEEQFCESAYYAINCCQTCRKLQKRKVEERQDTGNKYRILLKNYINLLRFVKALENTQTSESSSPQTI